MRRLFHHPLRSTGAALTVPGAVPEGLPGTNAALFSNLRCVHTSFQRFPRYQPSFLWPQALSGNLQT